MRKLMVLAATLAMALVVASPAMASSFVVAGDGGFDNGGFESGFNDDFGFDDDDLGSDFDDGFGFESEDVEIDFVDASQQQFAGALQVNTGDASAVADEDSVAIASVEQDFSLYQSQFNAGFDGDLDDDGIFDESDSVILAGDFDNNGVVDDFEF